MSLLIGFPTTIEALVTELERHVTSLKSERDNWKLWMNSLEILYELEGELLNKQPEFLPPSPLATLYLVAKHRDQSQSYSLELQGLGKGHDVAWRKRLCDAYEFLLRSAMRQKAKI